MQSCECLFHPVRKRNSWKLRLWWWSAGPPLPHRAGGLAAWRFFFFASHTLKPGFGGLFESDGPPTALGCTQLGGGGVRKQRGAPGYCQLSPPLYYFAALANSAGNAAVDLRFWQSVPGLKAASQELDGALSKIALRSTSKLTRSSGSSAVAPARTWRLRHFGTIQWHRWLAASSAASFSGSPCICNTSLATRVKKCKAPATSAWVWRRLQSCLMFLHKFLFLTFSRHALHRVSTRTCPA